MTPSDREGPGLRRVYSYRSVPTPPTKAGGAESPKPDTKLAQRAKNRRSQILEASDQRGGNESLTFRINKLMIPGLQSPQLKNLLSGEASKPQTPEFWRREGARVPP